MTKIEFLQELEIKLSALPKTEAAERIAFYGEMIDDRTEDGISEEDAVAQIGTPDKIASQIISEMPLAKIVAERIKPKHKLRAIEIILLILASPIWLPVCLTVLAVVFAIYAAIWAIVAAFSATFLAFCACAVGGIAACVIYIVKGNAINGILVLFIGLAFSGISILAFFLCKYIIMLLIKLSANVIILVKKSILKKENTK